MTNQNARRDDNQVPALLATSYIDGLSTVIIWGDPITHRLLVQNPVSTGSGGPNSTPTYVGQEYIDTANGNVYVATGTSSSANWTELVSGNSTVSGTTGAVTINTPSGSVNFAANASSLVVTNSRVTINSVILATVSTNDISMTSVQAVAGNGSFTLYPNQAPAAQCRVCFLALN